MKFVKGLVLLMVYTGVLILLWTYYEQTPIDQFMIPINIASAETGRDSKVPESPESEASGLTSDPNATTASPIEISNDHESTPGIEKRPYRLPTVKGSQGSAFVFNTDDRWMGTDSAQVADDAIGDWVQADDNYFSDAAFIGDSRTQGFQIQSGIKEGTFLTAKGLMVDTAFTKPIVDYKGSKISAVAALEKQKFGKVYIMLGVNELGWPYEQTFVDTYSRLIDTVQTSQPDATVYIQSIIHVSEAKSSRDDIYNNSKINRFNTLIKELAVEKNAVYLDLNSVLSDENGNLFADASTDGVHLNPTYCKIWYDYLKNHVWRGHY